MIENLEHLLEGKPLPGVAPLRTTLCKLIERTVGVASFAGQQKLCRNVFRLRFDLSAGGQHSVIVKLLDLSTARRCEMLESVWLPALELAQLPAALLATAEGEDERVWHVYEDVPGEPLAETRSDIARVAAAVERIAALHARSVAHSLLEDARHDGGDRGSLFFSGSVREAVRRLDELSAGAVGDRQPLRRRLLERLTLLMQSEGRYNDLLEHWGGPDVLLHGDLWPQNIVVDRRDGRFTARFIDWDRSGVGPVVYDLSTFLSRFPAGERRAILSLYETQISRTRLHVPSMEILNEMAALAEGARLASCVIFPAAAAAGAPVDWAWDELREVDEWFDLVRPLVPEASESGAVPA